MTLMRLLVASNLALEEEQPNTLSNEKEDE